MGWTTWACSPSTRSTSGGRSVVCRETGGVRQVAVLVPRAVRDHDVGARRAGRVRLGQQVVASHMDTDHSRPAGGGKPLSAERRGHHADPHPPPVARSTGRRRSAPSGTCRVGHPGPLEQVGGGHPSKPSSRLWLDAVVHRRSPRPRSTPPTYRRCGEDGKFCGSWPGAAKGTSAWHIARSAPVTGGSGPANIGSQS